MLAVAVEDDPGIESTVEALAEVRAMLDERP
jgi:hypothetical protein